MSKYLLVIFLPYIYLFLKRRYWLANTTTSFVVIGVSLLALHKFSLLFSGGLIFWIAASLIVLMYLVSYSACMDK